VPANEIVGLLPGELFVHRNIANVVVHSDLNCLAVIQFAVDLLHVEHIIVCGHYGCSGVSAAAENRRVGLSDGWLRHIVDVQDKHVESLAPVDGMPARIDRLCELNVIEQVAHVCRTTIVRDAWERGQSLAVHGWIYGLKDGLIRDLETTVAGPSEAGTAYHSAIATLRRRAEP
jgi:carbonic anhydrase